MSSISKEVKEFLESDRQWLRPHRIMHAHYQLGKSTTEKERSFWKAVINANIHEIK